jgi:hypothetical protein
MSEGMELDEVTVAVSRHFTSQELSLIVEALIASRAMASRPNFDEVDEETIRQAIVDDDIDGVDVPMREMTDDECSSLEEMIILFIGGLRVLEEGRREVMRDKVAEVAPKMISEIQEFLKGTK